MTDQASPDCPMCGHPPQILFAAQAFCGNDSCRCMAWNPTLTPAENLRNFTEVDVSDLEP